MIGAGASPRVKFAAGAAVGINQVGLSDSESLIASTVEPANVYLDR